jgi:hypothetical protein
MARARYRRYKRTPNRIPPIETPRVEPARGAGGDNGYDTSGNRVYKLEYASWDAFVDRAANSQPTSAWNQPGHDKPASRITDTGSFAKNSWTFGVDFQTAVHMARTGWLDGLSRLEKTLASGDTATRLARQEWILDMIGSRPCVPAYLAGTPATMWRAIKRPTGRRLVNLRIFNCMACSVTGEQIAAYGAGLVTAIDAIEDTGIQVELLATHLVTQRSSNAVSQIDVVVKTAGQQLDKDRLMFAVAHPACLRRLTFAVMESDTRLDGRSWVRDAYGNPKEKAYFERNFPPDDYVNITNPAQRGGVTVNVKQFADQVIQQALGKLATMEGNHETQ